MSYILQLIGFALALMGILFKSVKTDAEGKPLHTSYGLPVLTRTGKIVLTLISLSFLISLLNSWQQSEADAQRKEEAGKQQEKLLSELNDVKQRNEGLKEGMAVMLKASEALSEEQKKSFESVFLKQKESGEEIAGNIRASADLLRSRVDSSISLLNRSGQEITRAVNPFNELELSLLLDLPQHPVLSAYQQRVNRTLDYYVDNPRPDDLFSFDTYSWAEGGISYNAMSQLFPSYESEATAYYALREIMITVRFFKRPPENPSGIDARPDLQFNVSASADPREPSGSGFTLAAPAPLKVLYDERKRRLALYVKNVNLNRFTVTNNGSIVAVPDLRGAQMVISFGSLSSTSADQRALQEIQQNRKLMQIRLATPAGRGITLKAEQLPPGFHGYIFNFPRTTEQVFRLMN